MCYCLYVWMYACMYMTGYISKCFSTDGIDFHFSLVCFLCSFFWLLLFRICLTLCKLRSIVYGNKAGCWYSMNQNSYFLLPFVRAFVCLFIAKLLAWFGWVLWNQKQTNKTKTYNSGSISISRAWPVNAYLFSQWYVIL